MTKPNQRQALSAVRQIPGIQHAARILAFYGASRLDPEKSMPSPNDLEAASEHAGGRVLDEATQALLDLSPKERLTAIDELMASRVRTY